MFAFKAISRVEVFLNPFVMNNSEATDKIICRVRSKSALRLFGFSMVFAPAAFILAYSPARNERPLYKNENIQSMCLLFGEEPRNNTTASNVSASLFRPKINQLLQSI